MPGGTERGSGRLLVVSGPSGAGKSTIVAELLRRRPLRFSVSATTRAPRPGEVDGVHYDFVSRPEFERMIADGAFLEWAEYGSHLYGTPRAGVMSALRQGEDVVLEIEIQGARQVREAHLEALMVFVVPPDPADLERRLAGRGDTDSSAMQARLEIARREMSEAAEVFDHVVVNDAVDRAVGEIERILDS